MSFRDPRRGGLTDRDGQRVVRLGLQRRRQGQRRSLIPGLVEHGHGHQPWAAGGQRAGLVEGHRAPLRGGVEASPTERINLKLNVAYYASVEQFDQPIPRPWYWKDYIIVLSHPFSFWTSESDSELGWEATLTATYHYTEDLSFEAGWTHFFTADGLTDGNYVDLHGLAFSGGTSDEDADYVYWEGKLSF